MVNFSFDEEQRLFRRSLREWCQKELPLEKIREIDSREEVPRETINGLADLGLLLMTAPQEHGGAGVGWVTACIAAEELGYADISIAVPVFFLVENSWGFVVDKYCSEEVREEVAKYWPVLGQVRADARLLYATTSGKVHHLTRSNALKDYAFVAKRLQETLPWLKDQSAA